MRSRSRLLCAAFVVVAFLLTPILNSALSTFYPSIQAGFSDVAHGSVSTSEGAGGNAIFVPSNYTRIQDAVNAAASGDTIYVGAGNYTERVFVNKDNITLLGQGVGSTFLVGTATGEGFKIEANNVMLSGFTFTNFITGILLQKATNCKIWDNFVTGNKFGIVLSYSSDNVIYRNTATENEFNIRLVFSTSNTLSENIMRGNFSYNFGLVGSSIQHYLQTIDTSNLVNGKPIQYITNSENLIIDSRSYPNVGVLLVVNSSRITVEDLTITNNLDGILFSFVSDSIIQNVSSIGNKIGIELFKSQNIRVINNLIKYNMFQGIFLSGSSNCELKGNNVLSNAEGIYLSSSNTSIIRQNTLFYNEIGIKLDDSHDNLFFHNNLDWNQQQTSSHNSDGNRFDNGVEGNYWSNYRGSDTDNDAIGDSNLPHAQLDNYPLMGKYHEYTVAKDEADYTLEIISNSLIRNVQLNQSKKTLTFIASTGNEEGFARLTMPDLIVFNASSVTFDNQMLAVLSEKSNGTHRTLYFTYPSGDGHQIEIGANLTRPQLVAEAGPDQKANVGTIVTFNGNCSTGDLGIDQYNWNYGDGTHASGMIVSHFFKKAGTYNVTLEVRDTAGNIDFDSLTVTVEQSKAASNKPESENFIPTWLLALTIIVDVVALDLVAYIIFTRMKRKKKLIN